MILVDSSVWIDYFRAADTPQVVILDGLFGRSQIAVGDLIVAEVLQGVRDEREFNLVRKTFDTFVQLDLVGHRIALRAAHNVRVLRKLGFTVRKTIDAIIATRCIEGRITLLHSDRDFVPFSEHLGLRVAYSET